MMDLSSDDELLLLAVAIDEDRRQQLERSRNNRRRLWVHPINLKREQCGEFYQLVPDLLKDDKKFFSYFRMSVQNFDDILKIIRPQINKQNTNWRKAIPPEERLALTLRYLATGDSLQTIAHSYRVGVSTSSQIVTEVCGAIWRSLKSKYMPEMYKTQWENVAQKFEEKWGFPNCIGAIDGKHVTIKCPNNAGSQYFSYLKIHTIVLLAVVGPEYEFLTIDVGGYGRNSDGGIFEESIMGQKFDRGEFNIPDDKPLPGQQEPSPHVLVGDQAFALSTYLLRPYPYEQSRYNLRKDKFNTCLCKARRVVENAFGMLSMKFRIFLRPIELRADKIPLVVSACCVLHNILRLQKCPEDYQQGFLAERPNSEMRQVAPSRNRRAPNVAYGIRDKFADYFSNL